MQTATLSALDDQVEWGAFSRPWASSGEWESFVAIDGMHCAACSLAVEAALRSVPGVRDAQVNAASATGRVVWLPGRTSPSRWFAAVERAGYRALPAGDPLAAGPRQQAQRLLLWRWLVAGFCMMQVMMYAFPAYVAGPGELTGEMAALLGWASWTLTLPVVVFSCWPFFQSALRDLGHRRIGMDVPVALGILLTFAASTAATSNPSGPWGSEVWYDSLTMFVFFLLSGRLLEQRLRDRTAGSLEALMRRLPASVERLGKDGAFLRVPVRSLAAGDVVRVLAGEAFPADGTVTVGHSRVDEALLTGESRPLQRDPGQGVIAGSHNLTGTLLMRVERVAGQTRYAAIVALMEQASIEKPRMAQLADRVASPFLVLVLLAAAVAAAWWWQQGAAHALGVAVAVLIVTCPCALSLATPAATLAAAGALARTGVLVRRLQALEDCAALDTVIFDKTGTLTEDRMTVVKTLARPGLEPDTALRMAGALAVHSLHPAARAVAAAAARWPQWPVQGVTERPGMGVQGTVVVPGTPPRALALGSAQLCGVSAAAPAADRAQVHLADPEGWLATFDLDEAIRPDAQRCVQALRAMGMDVQLLSGDHARAVAGLARRAGIETFRSRQSPHDKLEHIRRLQRQGHRVAMLGDGLNDGPVLARADVSFAMGHAVPLAQAKADFVVPGGQLAGVASLMLHARRTRRIVRQNLAWAAAYNATCVPLAVLGFMPPWLAGLGMAASSLLVVLNSARLSRLKELT